ncbi:hypothetical protein SAMN04487943_11455 [Gracilibacillus orientalis]|uniref:Phosphoribosylanthranilate isomerase n=1 Tax=Gracilibacillus orientalis TaxID=334253 RepID=A0A1I4Q3H9_9BACI|nr:hypothetical protein [Gracilibacillus orientalis]SFM34648.1 hypothetical protein SAMN04487943_11455 [Gracilibacillus orientalis]
MALFDEFIEIAKTMNDELDIVPVCYGSLGLEKATGVGFDPQDIDILVPLVFLNEKWNLLKKTLEGLGYELIDLHEHEFKRGNIKIGISYYEDLKSFADIDYNDLRKNEYNGATYYTLTISEYLKVYRRSVLDGYRRTKNNNKDQSKIQILNELLQKR